MGAVRSLLQEDPTLAEAPDAHGLNALHWAAYFGRIEVVKFMAEAGANMEAASDTGAWIGCTPLHLAARRGHVPVVRYLVGAGAKLEAVDDHVQTPLLRAAVGGFSETVRCLLEAGANADAADVDGGTPLRRAQELGHGGVVKVLQDWRESPPTPEVQLVPSAAVIVPSASSATPPPPAAPAQPEAALQPAPVPPRTPALPAPAVAAPQADTLHASLCIANADLKLSRVLGQGAYAMVSCSPATAAARDSARA